MVVKRKAGEFCLAREKNFKLILLEASDRLNRKYAQAN